ncbi:hypothetical protein [Streptomyces sp. NPDC053367]|uniref:hypothetical protein n=1 Tax=Streptomyces sp. NPDC053367 TaxID=3365700 RepID=UPI0037D739F8
MADEQYGWLDRETAERLLRGQAPDAVGADAGDQAERLAEVLAALSATPAPTSTELPGEAAALAAFRSARAERPAARGAAARGGGSDAGLVRLGGRDGSAGALRHPRWTRPLRYGLAAALAAGMVGGVAVAAGTGVLPTPFDSADPAPAASVSAAPATRRPLVTPSPDGSGPSHRPGGSADGGSAGRDTARDSAGAGVRGRDRATPDGPGIADTRHETVDSCRAVRDGRALDAGRRRALEGAAGGSTRVWTYCKGLLGELDTRAGNGTGGTSQGTGQDGRGTGDQGGNGGGESDDKDKDKDEPGHGTGAGGRGDGDRGRGDGGSGGEAGDGSQVGDGDQVGGGSGDRTGDGHRRRDRSAGSPPAFGPALPKQPPVSPQPSQSRAHASR